MMSEFAQRLEALMKPRGLTKADLSRATEIPYHRLNPWFIREHAKPNGKDIDVLSRFFEVPTSYLLTGKPELSEVTSITDVSKRIKALDAVDQRKVDDFVSLLENQKSRENQ